ncbi:mRNA triphosphatase CET1 [Ramicandelaber brevisporus]|nr:mRNA triphosphatase CET1 [Ramicandelaber brevisporus]
MDSQAKPADAGAAGVAGSAHEEAATTTTTTAAGAGAAGAVAANGEANAGTKRRRVSESENGATATATAAATATAGAQHQTAASSKTASQQHPMQVARLEPSIFGNRPHDDLTHYVADFLLRCIDRPHIEIEVKLGAFIDRSTRQRLRLPIVTETAIDSGYMSMHNIRFESNMTMERHAYFNKMLNSMVEHRRHQRAQLQQQAADNGGAAPAAKKPSAIEYSHTKEIDKFYPAPQRPQQRIRVTYDQKTRQPLPNRSIIKDRVADLNIYSPRNQLDMRLSVNTEMPAEDPSIADPTVACLSERHKDRISYKHEMWQIDLTMVDSIDQQQQQQYQQNRGGGAGGGGGRGLPSAAALLAGNAASGAGGGNQSNTSYELEIEVADSAALVREGMRMKAGKPNVFYDMVQVFLDNARMLMRSVR